MLDKELFDLICSNAPRVDYISFSPLVHQTTMHAFYFFILNGKEPRTVSLVY